MVPFDFPKREIGIVHQERRPSFDVTLILRADRDQFRGHYANIAARGRFRPSLGGNRRGQLATLEPFTKRTAESGFVQRVLTSSGGPGQ